MPHTDMRSMFSLFFSFVGAEEMGDIVNGE